MDLIEVHVAWNDEFGHPDRMVAIEFGHDCELCAVETDCLDGDIVKVSERSFDVFLRHIDKENGRSVGGFEFEKREHWVGNIMWDLLWMTPDQCGRFAEWVQSQGHWSLNVAATEFWNAWGGLSGKSFVDMLLHVQNA